MPKPSALRARQLEAKILELGAENVAAFIGEPFQGAGGVIFPPPAYWPEIERICRRHDVLLIADEVIGGFGRVGEWFAHRHFGFEPDLITMAKGLTSGYVPMGAVALSDSIADAIVDGGESNHGFTYSGHSVAAAVAVAVANLKLLRDEGIVARVKDDAGPYFQMRLREALGEHPVVGEIAGAGLVAGIQLAEDRATHKRFANGDEIGTLCRDFCFAGDLVMRASHDRMLLSPPLVVTHGEIDEIVDKARAAIDATARAIRNAAWRSIPRPLVRRSSGIEQTNHAACGVIPFQSPFSTISSRRSASGSIRTRSGSCNGPSISNNAKPCAALHARYSASGRRFASRAPVSTISSSAQLSN
ncbi:Omega-amino acid pyruvate aminotransferase [Candidatus Paraburkholderia kirkii]|nr:Omega-amino acid pyruvate aminotransferase [Candidatus Paraburkholderia kirkii]